MRILGIETSCDETAAAIVHGTWNMEHGAQLEVLSNVVASQVKIHAKTGGVVPEVAARQHAEHIIPVIEGALRKVTRSYKKLPEVTRWYKNVKHKELNVPRSTFHVPRIDAIAVTVGPGLVTSLLVGVEVARTLSWLWRKPVIAVNHLAGHVYANFLQRQKIRKFQIPNSQFPMLCLIVSGGHTELVLMRRHLDFKVIGSTRDDAAGEAFDKVAKMLGLGYPGGPAISRYAEKWKFQFPIPNFQKNSKPQISKSKTTSYVLLPTSSIHFPRPMIDSPDFDFSFSGLKTAVLYWLRAKGLGQRAAKPYALSPTLLAAVCYEFQEAVVDVLVSKTIRAAKKYKVKTVLLGGGVAANQRLRQRLFNTVNRELASVNCILPSAEYTTDNAAMIAAAGYFMARKKQFTPWQKLDVNPNWKLGTKFKPLPR